MEGTAQSSYCLYFTRACICGCPKIKHNWRMKNSFFFSLLTGVNFCTQKKSFFFLLSDLKNGFSHSHVKYKVMEKNHGIRVMGDIERFSLDSTTQGGPELRLRCQWVRGRLLEPLQREAFFCNDYNPPVSHITLTHANYLVRNVSTRSVFTFLSLPHPRYYIRNKILKME